MVAVHQSVSVCYSQRRVSVACFAGAVERVCGASCAVAWRVLGLQRFKAVLLSEQEVGSGSVESSVETMRAQLTTAGAKLRNVVWLGMSQ
jgi:hypothetical protein